MCRLVTTRPGATAKPLPVSSATGAPSASSEMVTTRTTLRSASCSGSVGSAAVWAASGAAEGGAGGAATACSAGTWATKTATPPSFRSSRGFPSDCTERMISAPSMSWYQRAVASASGLRKWMWS